MARVVFRGRTEPRPYVPVGAPAVLLRSVTVLYDGEAIDGGVVRLVPADLDAARRPEIDEVDDWGPWSRWVERAVTDESIVYFAVEEDGALVGEIFLHDIDRDLRDAYVGCRIYEEVQRGRGLGRAALAAVARWTSEHVAVDRLYAIARADNHASCRVAQRCGFELVGTAREDENRNVYCLELIRSSLPGSLPDRPARLSVVECIFCSIVEGDATSWRVHEDEATVAFLDIGQVTPGHTLVVPRRHASDIWALSEDEAAMVMRSVHQVAAQLRRSLQPAGLNVTQSNGAAAWQEVFHYHVHLVPRYGNDGLRPPWRATNPTPEDLTAILGRITSA